MSIRPALLAVLGVVLIAGCRPDQDRLVVYSGRSQALVDAYVERFREAMDRDVRVRYGRDPELLAALEEEGRRSPADIFWGNTSGALAAAVKAGLLVELPHDLLQQPAAFVPASRQWLPLSVRFRVLAYNSERVDAASLPASVLDLPAAARQSRIGWTPTYSSFQDFVTAMRTVHGDERARLWLEEMQRSSPRAYPSNAPMLEALMAGEIDLALTNHYYVLRVTQQGAGGEHRIAMHQFEAGDVGNLALVTGAGILATSDRAADAIAFLEYLVSSEAQSDLAGRVFEYPVIEGAALPPGSAAYDEILRLSPEIDDERLRDIEGTHRLLRDVGAL